MTIPPRLVIADDHVLFREALAAVLTIDGFNVLAEASNGTEALALVCEHQPDIAILDVQMHGMQSVDLITEISEHSVDTRVVFLSMHAPTNLLSELEAQGAAGYFVKSIGRRSLSAGLNAVLSTTDLITLVPRPIDVSRADAVDLTPREQEVLALMSRSFSNKQIAAELYISEATVKRHISTIYSRLGVNSRVEALSIAMRRGIIRGLG